MTNAEKVTTERLIDNYYNHWDTRRTSAKLKADKEDLNNLFQCGVGINYDGMPHSPTPGNPPLETVTRIDEDVQWYQDQIARGQKKLRECAKMHRKVGEAVATLSEFEQQVLYMRFKEDRALSRKNGVDGIAEKLHYTPRYFKEFIYCEILFKVFQALKISKVM